MASTVDQVVLEVSSDLSDQELTYEYTRWTRVELIRFLNDALKQVKLYRPDAFTARVSITLAPGTVQALPANTLALVALDRNADNSCGAGAPITEGDLTLMRSFTEEVCANLPAALCGDPCEDLFQVTQYAYDERNPQTYYVQPAVPGAGGPFDVWGVFVVPAPEYDLLTVGSVVLGDDKYHNAYLEWMMYRALSKDAESVSSRSAAAEHKQHFYQMLGVNVQRENGFYAGYYLGQRGTGDANARS